jgi:hypothetical protein
MTLIAINPAMYRTVERACFKYVPDTGMIRNTLERTYLGHFV